MAESGKYIALEGPDGAGKTTQRELLKAAFEQANISHVITREPGGTAVGAELRQILLTGATGKMEALTEAFLFSADRCHLAESLIRPALAAGTYVISDRTYLTTLVFQGYGGRVPLETLEALTEIAVGETRPDLMLVLMVSPEKGLERKGVQASQGLTEMRMEDKGEAYHRRNADGYRAEVAKRPDTHVIIDADRLVYEVHAAIVNEINRRFGLELSPIQAMA